MVTGENMICLLLKLNQVKNWKRQLRFISQTALPENYCDAAQLKQGYPETVA
jgi:hypothetical protein